MHPGLAIDLPDDQSTLALAGNVKCVTLLQKVDILLQDIEVDSALGRVTENGTDLRIDQGQLMVVGRRGTPGRLTAMAPMVAM